MTALTPDIPRRRNTVTSPPPSTTETIPTALSELIPKEHQCDNILDDAS
eukprot:CAMPEP_0172485998 /NCGR_PEP_ID=MMETSP1066-20121228/14333_1 /TAXON_ID=671091 /ORGANISM="Coscinodiscus wailesii, Strain CCMP2513" /LENGTH=48 /DNA_ID= /DNA_START= /DNA_END= /DNA_ORIENTATION=